MVGGLPPLLPERIFTQNYSDEASKLTLVVQYLSHNEILSMASEILFLERMNF